MTIDLTGWLPGLLGPLRVLINGVKAPAIDDIKFTGAGVSLVGDEIVIPGGGGGGGSTPTGTGVRKIVSGVESAEASTIVNADVDAAAAIAGSKIQLASASNSGVMYAADFAKLLNMQSNAIATLSGAGPFNDLNPGDVRAIRFTAGAAVNLSGIVAPPAGVHWRYSIASTNSINLLHESSSSTAANRFSFAGGSNRTIASLYAVEAYYDHQTSRWRIDGYPDG
jgi:hypothetical protein